MSEQQVYDKIKAECDKILGAIGMSWDCLPDTNSIWDWVEEVDGDMTDAATLKSIAKDCCWDRLYDGGMDRDLATDTIYGEE